jgi:hypothetical protein
MEMKALRRNISFDARRAGLILSFNPLCARAPDICAIMIYVNSQSIPALLAQDAFPMPFAYIQRLVIDFIRSM